MVYEILLPYWAYCSSPEVEIYGGYYIQVLGTYSIDDYSIATELYTIILGNFI